MNTGIADNNVQSIAMELHGNTIRLPFSRRRVTFRYALVHLGYWILVTGFFIYEKKYLIHKASMPYFVACVSVRVLLLMLVAYLNLHFFLPNLLLKRRYFAYTASLLLAVTGYLIAQALFDYYLYGYVIGPLRNSDLMEALSYNFFSTLWYLALMLALKLSIDWYSQQVLIQQITVEKLNAELGFLRAQVNPHFLFNILNNLYALTLKKSDLAPDVVLKLSEMMEYMLYDSAGGKVLLGKEIAYINNYMELEKLRLTGDADISMLTASVRADDTIAPLLLIPLVENAFKHGTGNSQGNRWMRVSANVQDGMLTFSVENGTAQAIGGKVKGGIGLDNLRRRLQLLYPGKHELKLEEIDGCFTALMVIRL